MRVRDDKGATWQVSKGDPAWDAVSYLKKVGFDDIVLPRETLVLGEIRRFDPPVTRELPLDSYRFNFTLHDCCEALRNMV